jgi:hypothetical protein
MPRQIQSIALQFIPDLPVSPTRPFSFARPFARIAAGRFRPVWSSPMLRISVVSAFVLALAAFAAPAAADVLLIQRVEAARDMELPRRGESRAQVERRFGAPTHKHAPVGGGNPQHPPITRWDYAEFSVYFEHDHVVNAVLKRSHAHETAPRPVG